jgi:hypothetical protein
MQRLATRQRTAPYAAGQQKSAKSCENYSNAQKAAASG